MYTVVVVVTEMRAHFVWRVVFEERVNFEYRCLRNMVRTIQCKARFSILPWTSDFIEIHISVSTINLRDRRKDTSSPVLIQCLRFVLEAVSCVLVKCTSFEILINVVTWVFSPVEVVRINYFITWLHLISGINTHHVCGPAQHIPDIVTGNICKNSGNKLLMNVAHHGTKECRATQRALFTKTMCYLLVTPVLWKHSAFCMV
jgi:hypothetical protein